MELQEAALAASWYEGFHRLEYFASGTFNLELGIISAFSLNVILQINSIHINKIWMIVASTVKVDIQTFSHYISDCLEHDNIYHLCIPARAVFNAV